MTLTDIWLSVTIRDVKTTLDLDDELVQDAKRRALKERRPLSRLLEDALRAYLWKPDRPRRAFKLKLQIRNISPSPGVDFSDRDSLYERMDGRS